MPSRRQLIDSPFAASLVVGVLHAALLVGVALYLGYDVGPGAYSPIGVAWRYGGLVIAAVVPAWFAFRYRLLAPLVALALVTGFVLVTELTPPGPTFVDVAELEHLAEPTGIQVVENGLYIVRYMVEASVWTVGYAFLGGFEYAIRREWSTLPRPAVSLTWLDAPTSSREAALVASVGGLVHAGVMTWYAERLGVSAGAGSMVLLFAFGAVGMWLLAFVPLAFYLRYRLLGPMGVLTAFVLLDARAGLWASVDDPHALYFGGWFLPLGIVLVVAGIEYGLRRLAPAR